MTKIKILVLLMSTTSYVASAQNPLSQEVQTEFSLGLSLPFLHSGTELSRSADLRRDGLSYYQNDEGMRTNVGDYGPLIGWAVGLAWYRPLPAVDGLMLGTAFRTSLTGTQPSGGGYEEGYFFNFLSVGLAAKYYPFAENDFFAKADAGLASVFTKDRFLNSAGEQEFFHQFGIGANVSAGLGYSLTPFKSKRKSLDLQLLYQWNSVRVEVNGIGDDQWTYSALSFSAAINF